MTMIIEKMKKHQKAVLAFLLALVMLIGLIPFTATEVHAVEVVATAEDTEAFTGDFTLVLVSQNDPTKTETHTVTHDGTSWNDPKSSILPAYAFAYTGEVKDIAYSNGNWSYTPVLQSDQSDPQKLANADVMIATGTATKDAALDLNFEHYFVKVTFKVTLAAEFDETDEISNLYVVTKDSSTPEVKAYCSAANSDADYHYDCSAYIPAGIYAVGDTFVKIDIGDKSLEAKMSEYNPLSLTAGTHYTFYLKVGKDKVTVVLVSTNDIGSPFGSGWDNDGETDLN